MKSSLVKALPVKRLTVRGYLQHCKPLARTLNPLINTIRTESSTTAPKFVIKEVTQGNEAQKTQIFMQELSKFILAYSLL